MPNKRIRLLDSGYLEYIEHWGSDQRIVEAARMSTGKGFLGWEPGPCPNCIDVQMVNTCHICEGKKKIPGDKKLLAYLYNNNHATPFEMGGMIIEVKAPIMVFREWHRHRTQSYNEASARYAPIPNDNYIPSVARCQAGGGHLTKQAAGVTNTMLTVDSIVDWLNDLAQAYDHVERVYQKGLAIGIPKELARLPVSVGRYSKMRASANLRNWLGFLTLRMDLKAQQEIRVYANAVGELIADCFPRTWELFNAKVK